MRDREQPEDEDDCEISHIEGIHQLICQHTMLLSVVTSAAVADLELITKEVPPVTVPIVKTPNATLELVPQFAILYMQVVLGEQAAGVETVTVPLERAIYPEA